MEKYWTSILKKLIPELTRDTCYVIGLYLNVSDVYLLIETLRIPISWPYNIIGVATFYDNVELLKLAMSKGFVPRANTIKQLFSPSNEKISSYVRNENSLVNQYLKPLNVQLSCPYFGKSNILSKYKLENMPPVEMGYLSKLSFEEVKKLQPQCVALYFYFNSYFYDLNEADWEWIYETCQNNIHFKNIVPTHISCSSVLFAANLGFKFSDRLYSWSDKIIYNKNGENVSFTFTDEYLDFLVKHVPLTYRDDSIYNVVQNLWVLKRIHFKIKVWKRKCLELAFSNGSEETIQILHSKGLKTNKSCIVRGLCDGNIRPLEYEILYIKRTFHPLDLLKHAYHHWILEKFHIVPCFFHRNNNMHPEAIQELKSRGFQFTISVPNRYYHCMPPKQY